MGIIDHKWAGRALFFICFFLITMPKVMPAERKSFCEIGAGLSFYSGGEDWHDKATWGMGTIALMGKNFGFEALITAGPENVTFGGSLIFTTDSGAPMSAFVSVGGFSHGLLGGIGLRARVTKNIFLTCKGHLWAVYEGGFSLTFGAVYRF